MNAWKNKLLLAAVICTPLAQATPLAECLGLQAKDTAMIVNADDIGMHPDLDRAAFKLIDAGQIQDLSIMPPTPNADVAIAMAKQRKLAVGVHLTLTNEWQEKQGWGGVLPRTEVPSLYNPAGHLWATIDELVRNGKRDEMKKELLAQIAKVQKAGLTVTHLDAHMLFWNASREMSQMYTSLAKETGIPVVMQAFWEPYDEQQSTNLTIQRREGLAIADTFSMHYNPDQRQRGVAYQGYLKLIDALPTGVNTVAIHPAEDSPAAQKAIADLTLRLSDFRAWQDPRLQQKIKQRGIKTLTFAPLLQLQRQLNAAPDKNCLSN